MTDIRFGEPAWIDAILTRIGERLAGSISLAPDLIFVYEGEPTDLLAHPPADKFLVIAPVRLPVAPGTALGGGAVHTAFVGEFRVDAMMRVGGEREFRSYRTLTKTDGLSPFVRGVIDALQLQPLAVAARGISSTPLLEPMRLLTADYNPRRPQSGWSWCRTLWSVKFRNSFGN